MAYKHTSRTSRFYVGTSDTTMENKVNNLMTAVAAWLSGRDDCAPLTASRTIDGESKVLKGIRFYDTEDQFRLCISAQSDSNNPSTGSSASINMAGRRADGTFVNRGHGGYYDSLTWDMDFPILYNNPNTGLEVREDLFTNTTDATKFIKRIELRPIVDGERYSTNNVWFFYSKCVNVFNSDSSWVYWYGNNRNYKREFKYHDVSDGSFPASGYYTYPWLPFRANGPSGNYAIAASLSMVNDRDSNNVSFAAHLLDDSTLYRIILNGTIHDPDVGATITLSGVKFMALGDGLFVRMT